MGNILQYLEIIYLNGFLREFDHGTNVGTGLTQGGGVGG
jgi:hypothetical protein